MPSLLFKRYMPSSEALKNRPYCASFTALDALLIRFRQYAHSLSLKMRMNMISFIRYAALCCAFLGLGSAYADTMVLSSPAFANGGNLPLHQACTQYQGEAKSRPLQW